MKYEELGSKPDLAGMQDEVLRFWREKDIFRKSLAKGSEVIFYDGPPFPTGKPHHGTVLVSFIKDMIARYQTMQGRRVPRVWGWDCHGLPIENQAEKILGLQDKNEIERTVGIARFNDVCYDIVSTNNDAWRQYVEQMARWVDYDGAYKTMDASFMESVMWAFKQCYEKGLIYRDYRVTPYCCHCETSLSISDTRESDSTRPRQDRWVAVQFKTDAVFEGLPVYLAAWTTTPWTLPSNMALAVGENIRYAYVRMEDRVLVAGKNTLGNYKKIFGQTPHILYECGGSGLAGLHYAPIFPYFADKRQEGAFRVILADFVNDAEGLGVVHIAPAFGEDDYWACKKANIPLVNPVDEKGRFTGEITDFYQNGDPLTVIEHNSKIIRFLYERGIALDDGTIVHNYPHCWRCKNPLIYKAMDAWYFSIESIKDRLLARNEEIHWVPESVQHGRFGKWLEGARDWNISRNRYWSTPIPIWECDCCNRRLVLGSVQEIYEKSGVKLKNLHRQFMDAVVFPCECGGVMRRIPEVLDCWFESGSVPFAQKHYPFENKEWFDTHFPSDFIVEYTGQIRCWFYYLHVLAVALFDKPAYKNCLVHGTVLAKDGKKLSKSSKNYTDPMDLMRRYGTDAFRLYLYQTNAMLVGDLLFDEAGLKEALQQFIFTLWNANSFYVSYANIDAYHPSSVQEPEAENLLDRWILAKLYDTTARITEQMDRYQIDQYIQPLASLLDALTNWYIRRSRRRFWEAGLSGDKQSAYCTLLYVLVNTYKLFAPVAPILSEKLYRNLTGEESVHLSRWPKIPEKYASPALLEHMEMVRDVVSLARAIRNKNQVKNRQPLREVRVAIPADEQREVLREFADVIADELNVKEVVFAQNIEDVATLKFAPNFAAIREKYPKRMREIIQCIQRSAFSMTETSAVLTLASREESFDKSVVLVEYAPKAGRSIASGNGVVVSLDLTVTKELIDEGIAREIIRNIQDARKQAGYAIMDRITMEFEGNYPAVWSGYICEETLGQPGKVENPDICVMVQDDMGGEISIKIQRANS